MDTRRTIVKDKKKYVIVPHYIQGGSGSAVILTPHEYNRGIKRAVKWKMDVDKLKGLI